MPKESISAAISWVGLDPADRKHYGKYSLGMKQKLGIAFAIMNEPDVIILDEPINALDEERVVLVKKELLRLKEKGKLIIVARHDREELDFLSDEVIIMQEGKIIGNEVVVDDISKTSKA